MRLLLGLPAVRIQGLGIRDVACAVSSLNVCLPQYHVNRRVVSTLGALSARCHVQHHLCRRPMSAKCPGGRCLYDDL